MTTRLLQLLRPRRALVFTLALLALLAVLFAVDPEHCAFLPRCAFHQITGLDCPGCGATRATHQLLHGNFFTAFKLNPLFVIAMPLAIFYIGKRCLLTGNASAIFRGNRWIWVVVVIVVFGIGRNLPIFRTSSGVSFAAERATR